MKRAKYQQIRVVLSKDPKQFQDEFNEAQIELAPLNPTTKKTEVTDDGLLAIIQYEVMVDIPEDARDELEMQGVYLTCADCPRFVPVRNNDGTIKRSAKHGSCFLEERTRRDAKACEWFAKEYLKGDTK